MVVMRIFALWVLGCSVAWAQPTPVRPVGTEAAPAELRDGAKRRNELKAVLQAEEHGASANGRGMDAAQRQQLRRQLRENSGR